ncbi:MAG TPA: aminotransferase class I/II-fold pyridoxal phosphate-dependent enzyme [Urbifossiella sp.]|jgi:7-keto-8-aminopelargonate synthetase-like enzyme|nr:aminotransferase class I/II-fold pyridoxal phosphate-dependent enzyme [Urbifossiella sp.]
MQQPLDRLAAGLSAGPLVRHLEGFFRDHPDLHMKDMTVEETGPDRQIKLAGRWVTNFGSDSFLGLDRDPRLHDAVRLGLDRWGTHNGSSRAFSSVESNVEAENKVAAWLGADSALIYPSVTLTNLGALPALLTRQDAVVTDQYAHHSVQQGVKLAKAGGVKTGAFAHNDPADLDRVLRQMRPYRSAVVAVDGVYSMTGTLAALAELREVATAHDAILYVDDAHGTGVLGTRGRGTVLDALGDYANTIVVGSLSKAVSCFGGFVACTERIRFLLKLRSAPLIFGGPVPPPYLDAVCAAVDILGDAEGDALRATLGRNMARFCDAARGQGLPVLGGVGAIASVPVGDEAATLRAGRAAFDRGYYVQSVIFPAVPHHSGLLRVQINANHHPDEIDGLVGVLGDVVSRVAAQGRAA